MIQQQLQDHACGNRNQNVVASGLNPMVATRRCAQLVPTPVIDHVLVAAVFTRQTVTSVKPVLWPCTPFVGAPASVRVALTMVVTPATLLLVVTLRRVYAISSRSAFIAAPAVLDMVSPRSAIVAAPAILTGGALRPVCAILSRAALVAAPAVLLEVALKLICTVMTGAVTAILGKGELPNCQ
jgi:hypothetical protein